MRVMQLEWVSPRRAPMVFCLRLATALSALLVLGGCPAGAATTAPKTEACARVGDQCKLRDGLLGVCVAKEDQQCEAPPCLFCQPQH